MILFVINIQDKSVGGNRLELVRAGGGKNGK